MSLRLAVRSCRHHRESLPESTRKGGDTLRNIKCGIKREPSFRECSIMGLHVVEIHSHAFDDVTGAQAITIFLRGIRTTSLEVSVK